MNESRCGLKCSKCSFRETHGCGGCIDSNGHPFHGECPIALCCQGKGLSHCGQCDIIPCDKLYAYSYLDPEHGDKPQGARVRVCRWWAAEEGKVKWGNVLLTSGGFCDWSNPPKPRLSIVKCFAEMVGKPMNDVKVLFIPTAAYSPEKPEPIEYVDKCKIDLIIIGIIPENIFTYDLDSTMTIEKAMDYDCIYISGGDTKYLLRRMKQTGFDSIIKKFVYANKVYVGISAGSMIAKPNLSNSYDNEYIGLCLVNAYLGVHYEPGTPPIMSFPLEHIPLSDNQALAVSWSGYELVE